MVFHLLWWIVSKRDRTIAVFKQIRILFILWMLKLDFTDYWISFGRNFHLFLMFHFLTRGLLKFFVLRFLGLNVIARNVYIIWNFVDLIVEYVNILLFCIHFHFFPRRFAGHDIGYFTRLIDLLLRVLPDPHRRLRFVVEIILWAFLVLPSFLHWLAFDHFLNLFWHGFLILHSIDWSFILISKRPYE